MAFGSPPFSKTMPTAAQKEWTSLRREASGNRRHKYSARATVVDGIRFASQKEAHMYAELRIFQAAGVVSKLTLQPKFTFPMGFSYVADFDVIWQDGRREVIDTKGYQTPVFRLKQKCMAHFYPDVKLTII